MSQQDLLPKLPTIRMKRVNYVGAENQRDMLGKSIRVLRVVLSLRAEDTECIVRTVRTVRTVQVQVRTTEAKEKGISRPNDGDDPDLHLRLIHRQRQQFLCYFQQPFIAAFLVTLCSLPYVQPQQWVGFMLHTQRVKLEPMASLMRATMVEPAPCHRKRHRFRLVPKR